MNMYLYGNLITDEDKYDDFIIDRYDLIDKLSNIPERHTQNWWISRIREEDPYLTAEQVGWILQFLESEKKINDIRQDEGEFFDMAEIISRLEESHESEALSSQEWIKLIHEIGEETDTLFTEKQMSDILSALEKDGFVKWSCP